LAVESVGDAGFDPHASRSDEYTAELEYGVTSWWQTELELEFERDPGPGQATYFNQVTSENLFQFTERGQYWLDAGSSPNTASRRRKAIPTSSLPVLY
jgi:hypothetical protein